MNTSSMVNIYDILGLYYLEVNIQFWLWDLKLSAQWDTSIPVVYRISYSFYGFAREILLEKLLQQFFHSMKMDEETIKGNKISR